MTDPARAPFPFFVSCGRSGSTLLRSMMDMHDDLAIPGESFFITKLLPRKESYEKNGFDVERFMSEALTLSWTERQDVPTFIEKWGVDTAALRRDVIAAGPGSYAEAVRAVFRWYADWKGKSRYGDKTPVYVTGIQEIAALLPEARFVHLIRDGRNVALAFKAAPFGPKVIEEIALHWRARVLAGRRAGEKLGVRRYKEVKYEDLVEDSERSLTGICEWIGLEFQDRMMDHRQSVKNLKLAFDTTHRNVLRPVQQGIRDWRSQLDREEVRRFESIASDALTELGYGVEYSKISVPDRAYVNARRCLAEMKKVSRRMRGLDSAGWW